MKVKRIHDNGFIKKVPNKFGLDNSEVPNLPEIPLYSICTVIDEGDYLGKHFYRFSEYDDSNGRYKWWYDSRDFIPFEEDKEYGTEFKSNFNNT